MAKILVVEDNENNQVLFRNIIANMGHEYIETKRGMEAEGLIHEHKPDLVLMDIQLPDISGLEVTRNIRKNTDLHQVPIIAITAFAMHGDQDKIIQGGCDDYISKPISVEIFMEKIEKYLNA